MNRGPTELALESNAVADAVARNDFRAARRMLMVDRRFRARTKLESIELALEVVANMIAVEMGNDPGSAHATAIVRNVIDCLRPEVT